MRDLASQAFVFWPGHEGRGFFRRALALCHAAGFEPDIVQEARQIHGVISLVAAEAGVAIVPASMASVRSNEVHYRILDADPAAAFELAAARRADHPLVGGHRGWHEIRGSPGGLQTRHIGLVPGMVSREGGIGRVRLGPLRVRTLRLP